VYRRALEELARHLRRNAHRRHSGREQAQPLNEDALEGG
jgi:hypothetical protein